jgi:hypothetical protein
MTALATRWSLAVILIGFSLVTACRSSYPVSILMRASAPLQAKACALRPAILRRAPARQRLPLSEDHTAGRMEGRRRRAHHAAVGGERRREFGGQPAQGRARRRGLDLVAARSCAAEALRAESRRQPTRLRRHRACAVEL